MTVSFWAQSLDNQSPDIIIKDGKILDPSDKKDRHTVVSNVNSISENKKVKNGSNLTIYHSDPKFVIEVIPVERDEANRLAPIAIYGEFPKQLTSNWANDVYNQIDEFVQQKIQRTIDDSTKKEILNWLTDTLDKKKAKSRFIQTIIYVIALIILMVILGFLMKPIVYPIVHQLIDMMQK